MNIEFKKPNRNEYEQIVKIVNSASQIFFSIMEPWLAKELEIAEESVEKLKEGEKKREYMCLYSDGKMCAFSSYRFKNRQTLWISMLYVDPKKQRNGYGSILLKYIEEIAKKSKILVSVLETDKKANWSVNFYRKQGYRIIDAKDIKIFPFDLVLDKEPVGFRYLFGKKL